MSMCSTLTDKAEACAHPFGDKMVLTITGTKYQMFDPIVKSYTKPTNADTCLGPVRTTPGDKLARAAYGDDERDEREQPQGQLSRVNSAVVYHATMTVNSRLKSNKFHDGIFQFVTAVDDATKTPVSPAEAKDAYVLDPYKLKLSFFKPGDSY